MLLNAKPISGQEAFALNSYALRVKSGQTNANGLADGYAKVKGDDWGFGYTLSWLWDINDNVRVGANYRSKVKHTLKGHNEWILSDGLFNGENGEELKKAVRDNGYAEKEDASVKIITPESLSLHGMWKVNPQWNVFGDATWTRHSRFNQANLILGGNKLVSGPNPVENKSNETILQPNWRNTWKVSAGASYQYTPDLQLRAGLAYDRSPVKNADYRMTTMPDNDRVWLSLGAKYNIAPQHTVNAAYSHLFIKKGKANVNGYCGGSNAAEVACVSSKTNGSATYKSRAGIVGVQYTYKFR
ncbi:MAG: TonB-dependent receptor [Neisseria sp.]|nr:TonB-dependent receptor [Neisseria sp.]